MGEKMLVIQALDEREYLVRQIYKKIQNTQFADAVVGDSVRTCCSNLPVGEFCVLLRGVYPEIHDLIDRYVKLEQAILYSDAATWIETSWGKYTVAGALVLRARMHGYGIYEGAGAFEKRLCERMAQDYQSVTDMCGENGEVEVVDPLHISEKIAEVTAKTEEFLRELDKKILLSNATTYLET